ncbi:hypothetical protein EJ110_NYTH10698 [Nymphaea thermarum]|nr:hypothetical protein EJ110_NYTH10698 [Nymphaea thermarum]
MNRRYCTIVGGVVFGIILLLLITAIFFVAIFFRPKSPSISVQSTSVEGTAPHISFRPLRVDFNVTFHVEVLVDNPNSASFTIHDGYITLFFNSLQVGQVVIRPAQIPAAASHTIVVDITMQTDKLTTNSTFIDEVKKGEIHLESRTRIGGNLSFLGFIHRTLAVNVQCQTSISISRLKVLERSCTPKTDLWVEREAIQSSCRVQRFGGKTRTPQPTDTMPSPLPMDKVPSCPYASSFQRPLNNHKIATPLPVWSGMELKGNGRIVVPLISRGNDGALRFLSSLICWWGFRLRQGQQHRHPSTLIHPRSTPPIN